jgi:hypothetical protein
VNAAHETESGDKYALHEIWVPAPDRRRRKGLGLNGKAEAVRVGEFRRGLLPGVFGNSILLFSTSGSERRTGFRIVAGEAGSPA